jgi:hypothetical protein
MPIQAKSQDLPPLMHAAAEAAAAARQRGDMEEYDRQKEWIDVLGRLYHGFGTTEDMLAFEKLKQSPLQQIAKAGKWVAIGAGALLLLPYLTKLRK